MSLTSLADKCKTVNQSHTVAMTVSIPLYRHMMNTNQYFLAEPHISATYTRDNLVSLDIRDESTVIGHVQSVRQWHYRVYINISVIETYHKVISESGMGLITITKSDRNTGIYAIQNWELVKATFTTDPQRQHWKSDTITVEMGWMPKTR